MAALVFSSFAVPALGRGGRSAPARSESPDRTCRASSKGAYTCNLRAAGTVELSETAGLGRIEFAPDGKVGAVLQRDEGTVALLDTSKPHKPKVLGRYGTANVSLDGDLSFSSDGKWLFYARQTSDWDMEGVHVLDVSDPADPTLVGYAAAGGAYRVDYYEDDSGQWVVLLDAVTGLVVYEFEPTTGQLIPVHVDALPALKVGGPASAGLHIEPASKDEPALMYVSTGRTGLQIYDLSDPVAPAILGSWTDVGLAEIVVKVSKKQRLVYAATEYWFDKGLAPEIVVLDVTDPGAIKEKRRFSFGGDPRALFDAERLQGMALSGKTLYVAHSTFGLLTVNADTGRIIASGRVKGNKNPQARVEVAPYSIDVALVGGLIYLSDAATGKVDIFEELVPPIFISR